MKDTMTKTDPIIEAINNEQIDIYKIDWKETILIAHRMEQSEKHLPFIFWPFVVFSEIKNISCRIHILYDIHDKMPYYFEGTATPQNCIDRHQFDCRSLANFYRSIEGLMGPSCDIDTNDWAIKHNATMAEFENYLYYKHVIDSDNTIEYMAFVQANYNCLGHKSPLQFIPHIPALKAFYFRDKLDTKSIIEFCSWIYMAETTRLKYLGGWQNPIEYLTIRDIDRELRNRCFSYYIEHRIQDIRIELNKDNRRLHNATKQECLLKLLEIDTQAYRRLKSIGNLPGSVVYDQEWHPGTPDILAMTDLFLQYLSEFIDGTSVKTFAPSVEPQQAPPTDAEGWSLIDNIWYCPADINAQDILDFKTVLAAYIRDNESLDTITQFLINKDKEKIISLPRKWQTSKDGNRRYKTYDRAKIFRALKSVGLQYGNSRFYQVFPDKEA